MSRIEINGPGPWRGDDQIPARRQNSAEQEVVTLRQVRSWPDGGTECRDVVQVRRADGTVEVYERTTEYPDYHLISGEGFLGELK